MPKLQPDGAAEPRAVLLDAVGVFQLASETLALRVSFFRQPNDQSLLGVQSVLGFFDDQT